MNVLSLGMFVVMPCLVRLEPTANTTSARPMNRYAAPFMTPELDPSDSGCFSGKPLLPAMLVVTGICSSSASSTRVVCRIGV